MVITWRFDTNILITGKMACVGTWSGHFPPPPAILRVKSFYCLDNGANSDIFCVHICILTRLKVKVVKSHGVIFTHPRKKKTFHTQQILKLFTKHKPLKPHIFLFQCDGWSWKTHEKLAKKWIHTTQKELFWKRYGCTIYVLSLCTK